jgi:hypothetical protein
MQASIRWQAFKAATAVYATLLTLAVSAPAIGQESSRSFVSSAHPPALENLDSQNPTSPVSSTTSDERPTVVEMPRLQYPQAPVGQRVPPLLIRPVMMPPRVRVPPRHNPQSPPAVLGPTVPPVVETVSLSGPRFGYTSLSDGVVRKLNEDRDIEVGSLITQFGWQFEKQFYSNGEGLTILNEWVGLIGGLEQSVALPSLSWLVGFRTKEGAEFGLGPNLTPAGVALAVAGGVTFRVGAVNIPLNVAVVPSKAGVRVSMLTGFSLRTH